VSAIKRFLVKRQRPNQLLSNFPVNHLNQAVQYLVLLDRQLWSILKGIALNNDEKVMVFFGRSHYMSYQNTWRRQDSHLFFNLEIGEQKLFYQTLAKFEKYNYLILLIFLPKICNMTLCNCWLLPRVYFTWHFLLIF